MAVVDAKYQFWYVSVGAQGRASDAGVFSESDFKQALDRGLLNNPEAKHLPGSNIEVAFMLLRDDAYPLRTGLMKPFPFCQFMSRECLTTDFLKDAEWWKMGLV